MKGREEYIHTHTHGAYIIKADYLDGLDVFVQPSAKHTRTRAP